MVKTWRKKQFGWNWRFFWEFLENYIAIRNKPFIHRNKYPFKTNNSCGYRSRVRWVWLNEWKFLCMACSSDKYCTDCCYKITLTSERRAIYCLIRPANVCFNAFRMKQDYSISHNSCVYVYFLALIEWIRFDQFASRSKKIIRGETQFEDTSELLG